MNKQRLYKIGGKVFRLDPDMYQLAKNAGVTRKEIEQEYCFMTKITPGFKIANYNHAAYSAYVKKKGKSLWE
jgi:hypothetical protein